MNSQIRNFCILAHIDHGKSTLADRLLEITKTVEKRKMREQFLDVNPLEREKGITIKMQPVRMLYSLHSASYNLNLIDTPGHVDFSYEVSRALAAVESAVVLVDASQGIQAQTIANLHLAKKEKLTLIPVVNKIDLPSANIPQVVGEIAELTGVTAKDVYPVSAKTGEGIESLLEAIIKITPPPPKPASQFLRALVFDSSYDPYQGVIAYVRITDGFLEKGETLQFLASKAKFEALETGVFLPARSPISVLSEGEIGYVATGIKEPEKVKVGDTIAKVSEFLKNQVVALPGFNEPEPMVFASIFPENQDEYEDAREALKKLKLNDAALFFEPEESGALGRGFRAGFLGLLHLEIVAERSRREYNCKLIFANPSVAFKVKLRGESDKPKELLIFSAANLPPAAMIASIEEPWMKVEIITPPSYLGQIHALVAERKGSLTQTLTLSPSRLQLEFEMPLREIIVDFYDQLKSVTQGFASMAYNFLDYRNGDLVRMDILVAGEKVNAFSEIIPREETYQIARVRLEKLKELLNRELFSIALQAEVEGRIIARETISAAGKDVTGHLYGGDRTRKMKLWKKQKKGKKRLRERAQVEIPSDVFLKMIRSKKAGSN